MMILTVLMEVLLAFLVAGGFLGVVAFDACSNGLSSVLLLNLLKPLPVMVQALQPLQLREEVAFLNYYNLLVCLGAEN